MGSENFERLSWKTSGVALRPFFHIWAAFVTVIPVGDVHAEVRPEAQRTSESSVSILTDNVAM